MQRHLARRIVGVRLLGTLVKQVIILLRKVSTRDIDRLLKKQRLRDAIYAVSIRLKITLKEEATL